MSGSRAHAPRRRILALALAAGAVPLTSGIVTVPSAPAANAVTIGATTTPAATTVTLPHPSARAASAPVLALVGVSPSIAAPGEDVTVQVALRNPTAQPATPTVSVGVGSGLTTREDVAQHASRPATDLPSIASTTPPQLAPGARTTVSVRIPADRLRLPRPFGVLPLTVSVTGLPAAGPIATFLPYQVVKEYEPLQLSLALPVTADADPVALTGALDQRTAARARMVQTGSRLDRVVKAAEATDATLIADPTLLDITTPVDDPTAVASAPATTPTPGPSTGTTGEAEASRVPSTPPPPSAPAPAPQPADPLAALGARVAATHNDVWLLPPGDPDVSALVAAQPGRATSDLFGLGSTSPAALPGHTARATSVVWPAGSSSRRVRGTAGRAPVIVRESRADPDPATTGSAARQDEDGRRVLVTDDRLSATVAGVTAQTAPAMAQQALADSITLLAESPGRERSVLLLPDRTIDPDPPALAAVMKTLRGAPWITSRAASSIITAAPAADPVVDPQTPATGPASPITSETLPAVEDAAAKADGMRDSFGSDQVPDDLTRVAVSTRWRGHGTVWRTALREVGTRFDTLSQGVGVVPSAVNFFAEHGILQVTVVNDLDVEVRNVYLRTDVQGPARLRILSEPEPLTIRPHSRTTVRLDVEAVAAGLVPITTSLQTADGIALGSESTVRVQVRPTNGWVVLAAGGVVGVIFLLGLFRAIRLGERRVAEADMRDLDLD